MAKATVVVKESILLEITSEEADYLQAFLQNYLGPGEESEQHYDIRAELFSAITRVRKVKT